MVRAIVCAAALMNVILFRIPVAPGISGAWYEPYGFMVLIPKPLILFLLGHAQAASAFTLLTALSLLLTLAGWKTRPMLWIATSLYLVFIGLAQSSDAMPLSGVLTLHLLFFLCWLPCDEGFSIERKREGIQDDNRPSQAAGWSIFLLRVVVAGSLFQAGVTKLRFLGFSTLDFWQIQYWLLYQALPSGPLALGPALTLLYLPVSFWRMSAALLLCTELFFPAVLFSWHLRRIFPVTAAAILFVNGFSRGNWMPDVLLLLAIFYDWDRVFSPPGSRRGLPAFKRPVA